MFDSYMICTSPRSGSTMLCRLLAATGIAGLPASYFYDLTVEEWCVDNGLTVGANETERDTVQRVVNAAIDKGRNGTAIFAVRQQANGHAFLCEKLAILHPQETTDLGRVERAFGKSFFIHLTRPDKIRQAVSYLRAAQTGLWHVASDGSELERNAPHNDPSYDAEALRNLVEKLTAQDRAWSIWFRREGIDPLRIVYDDLATDPVETLRCVLDHLGLDRTSADGITPDVRKLSDNTSEEWVARFQMETGHA